MSEEIKHECGIVLLRLKKPISYYQEEYGTPYYGLEKTYLLMEKQHNRGQDGAGLAVVKQSTEIGLPFIFRSRSDKKDAISLIFQEVYRDINEAKKSLDNLESIDYAKIPYVGQIHLGHLRYATHSQNGVQFCHPFIRQSYWKAKNLVVAGNFNLTNNDELLNKMIEQGQHPIQKNDTVTVLERIGYYLDRTIDLNKEFNLSDVLYQAFNEFDGGYVIAGVTGDANCFVVRDPNGIRPAYWYEDDEIFVVTSERPPIKTAFNVDISKIQELKPGCALVYNHNSKSAELVEILPKRELYPCSFERIYFSRGTDIDIYKERKALGRNVSKSVLEAINYDFENSVFSYIPNTAEVAFLGMMEAVEDAFNDMKITRVNNNNLDKESLKQLLNLKVRKEKIAIKDAKLRTFITADNERNDLVNHIYDTTYGVVKNYQDNLVIIDDSIVRGTTLKNSIIKILDRLKPKKILIVSSAPQIRYPDCYGIDMSKLKDFIAFKAAIFLLKNSGNNDLIDKVYHLCIENRHRHNKESENFVKLIYEPFKVKEINKAISELLTPEGTKAEVEIVYQTIESLHDACPQHRGDWYFTGNYPTNGGNKVANQSFINFYESKDVRAY